MLKSTARFATLAIAGTLVIGGGVLTVGAESSYNSTAVAGITLSVDNYLSTIEDQTPAVATTEAAPEAKDTTKKAKKKSSGKYDKLVVANVENVVNVRKKNSKDSKIVGQMYKGDGGKVIKKGKNWTKIKSGNVKGWVKNDFLLFGDEAQAHAEKVCNKVATVTTTTLKVREKKSKKSDCLTLIAEGNEYNVKKVSKDWVKISVDDDLKGYVSSDYVDVKVDYGEALTMKEIQEIEEANAAAAAAEAQQAAAQQTATTAAAPSTQQIKTTEEQSVSTIKPTKKTTISAPKSSSKTSSTGSGSSSSFSNNQSVSSSSTSTGATGSAIASYACQFVGNPYVYGGTSLTNGADCSGFVQSVYKHFGYSLSRTAAAQAGNGTSVSLSNLQPGDLLFYKNGGGIGHVAIYIGGGQIVHASSKKTGIKTSPYNYRTPCKAVRIVK